MTVMVTVVSSCVALRWLADRPGFRSLVYSIVRLL